VVIPKVHHTTTAQSVGFEGLGGGALNKLFAKCINFALLAAMQMYYIHPARYYYPEFGSMGCIFLPVLTNAWLCPGARQQM